MPATLADPRTLQPGPLLIQKSPPRGALSVLGGELPLRVELHSRDLQVIARRRSTCRGESGARLSGALPGCATCSCGLRRRPDVTYLGAPLKRRPQGNSWRRRLGVDFATSIRLRAATLSLRRRPLVHRAADPRRAPATPFRAGRPAVYAVIGGRAGPCHEPQGPSSKRVPSLAVGCGHWRAGNCRA